MWLETLWLALRTLRGNLFRTLLTVLSVTVGTFSIVVMLSLAQSGHQTLSQSVEEIGGMRLILWIPSEGDLPSSRQRAVYDQGFTARDMTLLRQIPRLASVTSESTYGRERVWAAADNAHETDIVGALDGLFDVLGWEVEVGRVLDETDNLEKRRVCVLTAGLAERLFPDESNVIGKTVFVGHKPYFVVGVLEPRDLFGLEFGFDWDNSVFIPQVTAEVREGRPEEAKFIIALTEDPKHNDSAEKMGNAALLANHRGIEDFESLNFASMLEQFYQFFLILDGIVAVIAGISLFAGGIGVMNIMLVSVTERTREIGIRKAIGASNPAILFQFLTEALVLSLTGGLVGVGAGLLTTALLHAGISSVQDRWVATFSLPAIGLSLATTAVIGLVFGAVPAWRASKLDIVEALRR